MGKLDVQDVKEKIILMAITVGIFLPVRMVFTTYISDHWLGSLGLVSLFALFFIYLVRKKKMGFIGKLFEKQMKKTIGGRLGKYVIAFAIVFLIYFGASIFLIDRGNSVYYDDKEILFAAFQNSEQINAASIPIEELQGPVPLLANDALNWLSNVEYTLSVTLALMNDMTDGWIGSLMIIVFVEQFEVLGILYFFRRSYKQKSTMQVKAE